MTVMVIIKQKVVANPVVLDKDLICRILLPRRRGCCRHKVVVLLENAEQGLPGID